MRRRQKTEGTIGTIVLHFRELFQEQLQFHGVVVVQHRVVGQGGIAGAVQDDEEVGARACI